MNKDEELMKEAKRRILKVYGHMFLTFCTLLTIIVGLLLRKEFDYFILGVIFLQWLVSLLIIKINHKWLALHREELQRLNRVRLKL